MTYGKKILIIIVAVFERNTAAPKIEYPGIAQLVARVVRDHEAVGSSPATRTK